MTMIDLVFINEQVCPSWKIPTHLKESILKFSVEKSTHQELSGRIRSQWTPVIENNKIWFFSVFIFFFIFHYDLPLTVECMQREESPPSCPFAGFRSPTRTFCGEEKCKRIRLLPIKRRITATSIECVPSTWDWTRFPEKLTRFGSWPDIESPPVHFQS